MKQLIICNINIVGRVQNLFMGNAPALVTFLFTVPTGTDTFLTSPPEVKKVGVEWGGVRQGLNVFEHLFI